MEKHHFIRKRASAYTAKGSITLEMALSAPIFFAAIVCVIFLFEIMAIKTVVRQNLHSAGKEMAQEAYVGTLFTAERLEQKMDQASNRLILDGFDCSKSKCHMGIGVMDLVVEYQIQIPMQSFHIPLIHCREKLRIKGWTGYGGDAFAVGDDEIVYITETGLVYHSNPECTHLDLSIRVVEKQAVPENLDVCLHCKSQSANEGKVYITDEGDCYHMRISCSALKRTVFAVKKSEVYGRGGCERCVR